MKKQSILFCTTFALFIVAISNTSNAQNSLLGFKNATKENKIEKDFDAQLSAKRVGENIKLLSSVPHHISSVGGKFVAEQIAKTFRENGWDTKI